MPTTERRRHSARRESLLGDRPGAFASARYVRITPMKARRVVDMVRGLPVDDKDDADRPDGRPVVRDLTTTTLNEVFQPAGGSPVSTQVAEVQRRRQEVLADVESAGNESEKRAKLAGLQRNARTLLKI